MSVITLDGSQFTDITTYLLGALTLAGATGQGFAMRDVGEIAGTPGVRPLHLTAMRAMASLCGAEMSGDTIAASDLRFVPRHPPRARDIIVDVGETTGRPSPAPMTPLVEMLIPALALAKESALLRFRGANATPHSPSGFWLRETLAPMLAWLGLEVGVEIERWGWHPDGGGELTLMVTREEAEKPTGSLVWEERGDPVELWALVALSPRANRRIGQQMLRAAQAALAEEPIRHINVEEARVRSPGPGSGIFLSLQCEHVLAGFEAISHSGTPASQVVEGATSALASYFWSDAAFEPELARAMMLPIALSEREASYTTSEITLPMRVLADLIPRFLPATVSVEKHPRGGQIEIRQEGRVAGLGSGIGSVR